MMNLISNAIETTRSLLKQFQFKSFFSAVLVGFLVLTPQLTPAWSNPFAAKSIDATAHEIDNVRPKTTDEWKQEARETDGKPGERADRIAKEAGQAFKEFGSGYAKAVKDSTSDLGKSAAQTGEKLADQVQR